MVVGAVKLNYSILKHGNNPAGGGGRGSFSLICESYSHMSMFAKQNLTLLGQPRYSSSINKQPTEALMKNNEQPEGPSRSMIRQMLRMVNVAS